MGKIRLILSDVLVLLVIYMAGFSQCLPQPDNATGATHYAHALPASFHLAYSLRRVSGSEQIAILKNIRNKVRYMNGDCSFEAARQVIVPQGIEHTAQQLQSHYIACTSTRADYNYSLRGPPLSNS